MTPTTATMTSRLPAEDEVVVAEVPGGLPQPEDVAVLVLPGAGLASLRGVVPDQAGAHEVPEEVFSREAAAGYVVRGVAAVEI